MAGTLAKSDRGRRKELSLMMQKSTIYIGDFDLRNENVQAHLVRNNAKILNRLGYKVAFVGVNRDASDDEIRQLPQLDSLGADNSYLELENTLSISGLLKYRVVAKRIMSFMDEVAQDSDVRYVISYQSPTYASILKRVADWCRRKKVKYIVNCADITIFDSQPLLRRIVMTLNWNYLHKVNKTYADGLIAVSSYISQFYHKEGMFSVVIPPLFDSFVDGDYQLADKTTFVYAGMPFVLKKNVSTVGMKDRLDKIIDLCLELSSIGTEYRLLVIGITKDLYTTCVPRHKDSLEKNDDILFVGRYSHQDTLNAVRNADFMLNIRDNNIMNQAGLSTKVVESISLGTPVVMNPIGDTFSYLREGETGVKLTDEMSKNVEILRSLCARTRCERMELKARCAGDRTFSIERYEEKLNDFLSEVGRNSIKNKGGN